MRDPKTIRNVALVGHHGTGKTALAEKILMKVGKIKAPGISDFDDFEKEHGMSVNLTLLPFEYEGVKVNMIDTPGYLDFAGEACAALHVSETAIFVLDISAREVGVQAERLWDRGEDHDMPRIIFVNKMDKEGVNFREYLEVIWNAFGKKAMPLYLPVGEGPNFKGLVSIFSDEFPEEVQALADELKERVMDLVVEIDDEIMEKYLGGEEITKEEIGRAMKEAFLEGNFIPVIPGSVEKDIGIDELLKVIKEDVPSPAERIWEKAYTADKPLIEQPFGAITFKVYIDTYIGKIVLFRVFGGSLKKGDTVLVKDTGAQVRINHIYEILGKELTEIDEIGPGDMGAITKVEEISANQILTDPNNPVELTKIPYPQPIMPIAIEPKTKTDQEKLLQALHKCNEEDPSFETFYDTEMHQTVVNLQGDVQQKLLLERLHNKYHVDVNLVPRKVPYRETIKGRAKAVGKFVKQTGGHGQYAVVHIEIWPLERGKGYEFEDAIFGGAISRTYIPSVDKGVRERMAKGVIAGYPVVDVHVKLFDGKEHPVDSSDYAFQVAGSLAFQEAMMNAKPILLEPIYKLTVKVPKDYVGDIMGDINSRRGRIIGMDTEGKYQVIIAEVPYAELMDYARAIRSITGGRGTFQMEFDHYAEVPAHMAEKIIAESQKEED
ncbi:elongation factor G [bacterium 3DAC]|jgi:elongation factor G|nr:elongation factor G [Dictyoglomota bacterium]UZN23278.1 elongation factor G [bacterium 3DAC]